MLPDCERILTIRLPILTQYRSVTDIQAMYGVAQMRTKCFLMKEFTNKPHYFFVKALLCE